MSKFGGATLNSTHTVDDPKCVIRTRAGRKITILIYGMMGVFFLYWRTRCSITLVASNHCLAKLYENAADRVKSHLHYWSG